MKKIFNFLLALCLIFSVFVNASNVGAIENTQDQSCSTNLPYTLESSDSVFENGSLGQTFVPTQNRLNTLVLNLLINAADDESVLTVSITDFNEETILASKSINITASLDGDQMLYIDFYDYNWQQYDVPLTPGDTYKIKLTSTTGGGNVRWSFRADPNCVAGGLSIVGGVMNLDKDFGFTTMGYTYVAPVVPPADTPAPAVAPTTTPTTPTADANTPDTTTAEPAAQTTDATTGDIAEDNVELVSAQLISSDDKMPSLLFWSILTGGIILLAATITFLQIKFKIFNKIFKSKKVKFAKK
jgi:hypothetical protein